MKVFPLVVCLQVLLAFTCAEIEDYSPSDTPLSSTVLPEENGIQEQTETTTFGAHQESNAVLGRHIELASRKKKGGMEQMYMMFMMWKSFISTALMFVQPVLQVKAFGLSVITILINLTRLLIQLRDSNSKHSKESSVGSSVKASLLGGWTEERIGAPYHPPNFHPNYINRYTIQH